MANKAIEKMLKKISRILGTNREIKETGFRFYRRLQRFVDSKKKSMGNKNEDIEFWRKLSLGRIV